MKRSMFTIAGLLMAVLIVGCNVTDNLKSKSWNVGVGTIGGKLTTAVDPNTGTPLPSVELVEASGDVMSHKPGDGTQITISKQKSLWSSETANKTVRINAKGGMKAFSYKEGADGSTEMNCEEHDTNVTTDDVTATTADSSVASFQKQMAAIIDKNTPEVNAKVRAALEQERAANAADPKLKDRFAELAAMPDAQLSALKAGSDPADNRMIGNEVLWRAVNKK
ncbi:MAG: hypothetical protein WCI51_14945 [Lentisphaerota bacterium]